MIDIKDITPGRIIKWEQGSQYIIILVTKVVRDKFFWYYN